LAQAYARANASIAAHAIALRTRALLPARRYCHRLLRGTTPPVSW